MSQPETVHLTSDDTQASIRERLRATQGNRILLVIPKDCPGLDSVVDLKLLSRQAAAMEKEVALVASNRELRELARSLGFRAFSSTAWARRTKWRPPKKGGQGALRRPLTRESIGRALPAPESAGGIGIGGPAILAIAFLGMISSMLLLAAVLVPTAKVTLHPLLYPVNTTLVVEANPSLESVDFVGVRIPARVVELEVVGNDEIATTAVRDEPEARALGEVVFTNRRSEATTVVSDTIVTTSAGTTIRFRTTQEVTIPPGLGSRARAPIEAMEPGPSGNVPAYSINRVEGPIDRQVNVINAEPTAGGGVSQVTYVTSADKDQLSESTLHQLKENGYSAMVAELAEQEILPRESLLGFVLSETYDKFPGEVSASLSLHMRALVRGTVIDREDVELLGLRMLQFEVREGFQLLSDATEVRLDEVTDMANDGTLTLAVTAAGLSWVEINELEIKDSVRGKSVTEAEEYLTRHLSLAEDPTIEVSPDWWARLPWLPFRITVEVVS